jgi:Tfp pilus assembly protein PilF
MSDTRNDADHAVAHYNRGMAFRAERRLVAALASFDEAIALNPVYAQAFNARGGVLHALHHFDEALVAFDEAIAIKPDYAAAFGNRGITLKALGRSEAALASYDAAIALNPGFAEAYNNHGNLLTELKRTDEALADYDKAIALKPNFADAFKNRAHLKLMTGRFEEGWRDYEWRFDAEGFPDKPPVLQARPWNGEDLSGRHIVVFGEQGMGDTIQFARYLPLLARKSAEVTFVTDGKLVRLLHSLPAKIRIVRQIGGEARFDFQCALMSLPLRFDTDVSSIPNAVPYLASDPRFVLQWRERIGSHGLKIGIAWQGSRVNKIDAGRSIPLQQFVPLARVPGVRLISLQKQFGTEQLAQLPDDIDVETLRGFDEGPDAFIDTAAVMANLDLIVTCDTSIAHLAGALARPVWVAFRHVPDWRWMLDREDSPWYPTMRLFRQKSAGDWSPVFTAIERQLRP